MLRSNLVAQYYLPLTTKLDEVKQFCFEKVTVHRGVETMRGWMITPMPLLMNTMPNKHTFNRVRIKLVLFILRYINKDQTPKHSGLKN